VFDAQVSAVFLVQPDT